MKEFTSTAFYHFKTSSVSTAKLQGFSLSAKSPPPHSSTLLLHLIPPPYSSTLFLHLIPPPYSSTSPAPYAPLLTTIYINVLFPYTSRLFHRVQNLDNSPSCCFVYSAVTTPLLHTSQLSHQHFSSMTPHSTAISSALWQ